MKTKATKFTSKLGTSKGTERSRIWLQGSRLTQSGFIPKANYVAIWTPKALKLLRTDLASNNFPAGAEDRVVSGKGDVPIIDIVGKRVVEVFGGGTHVDVTFDQDQILIKPSKG